METTQYQQRIEKAIAMILVEGSANLDFAVRADHILKPDETVLGNRFSTYPGGKGANQAVASAWARNIAGAKNKIPTSAEVEQLLANSA
jgi:hypothetical protein